jgi:phosphodiesterase/alkaline phosphatase D-like protein
MNMMKELLHNKMKGFFLSVLFLATAISWGQTASLPISAFTGGRDELPTGFTQIGLGTDYAAAATKLKFDTTADQLLIAINAAPGTLTYRIVGNPSSGSATSGTFLVEQSATSDGTYTILRTITNASNTSTSYTDTPAATTRYIRFRYSVKNTGNIGLGTIALTAGAAPPAVTTTAATAITANAAISGGNVTAPASGVTARGVVWTTSATVDPTTTSNTGMVTTGSGTGTFTSALTNLTAGTTYYYRAYATAGSGTGYGNKLSFTTLSLPTVTTSTPATAITANSAIAGGNVNVAGSSAVTERGVVWSTSQNPTIALPTRTSEGTGTGTFTSSLTGLALNTTYYYRAYATNEQGTAYGAQASFRTLNVVAPTVTTTAFDNQNDAGTATATLKGSVANNGGAAILQKGFIYNTTGTNLEAGQATTVVNTTDPEAAFTTAIEGLALNTRYYYAAFATNNTGTGYGLTNNFYTHAATPGAPGLANATTTSLTLTANANGNPVATEYLVRVMVGGTYRYVNEFAELQSQPVWLTGSFLANPVVVSGLNVGTNYTFDVKARNVAGIETPYSDAASLSTVTPSTPFFTLLATDLDFGPVCINTTSAAGYFTFRASNLPVNQQIAIYGLTGFTYSLTENGIYNNGLFLTYTGEDVTVYVKFTPTQVKAYPEEVNGVPGTISINSSNTDTLNVTLSGAGINTPATAVTGSATAVATTTATVAAQALPGCSNLQSYGIEYSATTGFANGSGTQIAGSSLSGSDYSVAVSGLAGCTSYYYKAYTTDATGTHYGQEQSFTTLPLSQPTANTAGAISQTGFTASWTAVPGATGYYLDVSASPTFETVYLSEDFAAVVGVEPAQDTNIASTINNYTSSPGWSGQSLYRNETGNLKLGTTTQAGFITTPAINLAANGGAATLSFRAKYHSTDSGKSIRVMHAPNGSSFTTQLGANVTPGADFATYTVPVTGGTANSKFRIEAVTAAANRFHLDDIKVIYSQSLENYSNLAVTGTTHEVTGLQPNTVYYYRVRAAGGCTSANSNIVEVKTLTYLTLGETDLAFGDVCTTTEATGSFTFTGTNMANAALTVAALNGYSYSLTENGTFTPTLEITGYNSTETTVFVKFDPTAVQAYNGNIIITGQGGYAAATLTIPVTGAGIYTPATATAGMATAVTMVSATLAGQSVAGNCATTTAYGIEYSTNPNFANGTGTQLPGTNSNEEGQYTVNLNGLSPCKTYYYKAYTTNAEGTVYSTPLLFTTLSVAVPGALAGTNVTESGFTANWEAAENAQGYRIDVSTDPAFGTLTPGAARTETFNNLGNFTSYATRAWTGDNNIGWNATDARTDQPLNGRAITLRAGSLTNTTVITGGLDALSFNYKRVFAGNSVLQVYINGTQYGGDIAVTSDQPQAFSVDNLNIAGTIAIELRNTGGTNSRTVIDDLTLTSQDVVTAFYVPGYENKAVAGNVTSLDVTGLEPFTNYYYRVRAYTDDCTTANSNTVAVNTKGAVTWTVVNGTAKWMPEFYPDGTTPVVIDETTPTIIAANYNTAVNGVFSPSSITINNGVFTVASRTTLTVENEIINNLAAENFIVENNGNLLQVNDVDNAGAVTVNRNGSPLYREDYTMWSSPVTGQKIYGFSPRTLPNRFYSYDSASDNFVTIPGLNPASDTTFDTARGYLIRMPNSGADPQGNPSGTTSNPAAYQQGIATMVYNGKFKGVPNNGDITLPLSTAGNGYNLVGNPYPSPIVISDFQAANQDAIDGSVWVYRKKNASTNSAYVTVNSVGIYTGNDAPEQEDPQNIIRTGQGFIVKVKEGFTTTGLVFNNGMRSNNTANQFFRTANHTPLPESHGIWLNLTNSGGFFSQMYTGYIAGATNGVDNGIDAEYINDKATVLATAINQKEYIIQGRSLPFKDSNSDALQLRAGTAGEYTIAIDHLSGLFANGQNIYLKDNLAGVTHSIKESPYTFTTAAGTFANRFEIVYTDSALGTDVPLADLNKIMVYKQGNGLAVTSGTVQMTGIAIFDMRGRKIYSRDNINAGEILIDDLVAQQQVLIVQVTTEGNQKTSRKIVY